MGSAARLSVYVLHWNAPDRAAEAVRRLRLSEGLTPEITIIDNASDAAAVTALRAACPSVEVVTLPENAGYAGAANAALSRFLATAGADDWCVLAAHDALVEPATLSALANAAGATADFGVLGPSHWSRDFARRTTIGGRWGMAGLQRARLVRAARSPHQSLRAGVGDTRWVSGALFAVRSACARSVGGFDEHLFAYWEDVDYCLRAAASGWRVGVVVEAAAAESGFSASPFGQAYYMARNHLLVARKHLGRLRTTAVAAIVAGMAIQAQAGAAAPWRTPSRRKASRDYARGRWLGLRDGLANRGGPVPCA